MMDYKCVWLGFVCVSLIFLVACRPVEEPVGEVSTVLPRPGTATSTVTATATNLPTPTPTLAVTATLLPTVAPTLRATADPDFLLRDITPESIEAYGLIVTLEPNEQLNDLLLHIRRDGQRHTISVLENFYGDEASPVPLAGGSIEIVQDLDSDGEPEIVLDIGIYGTNCCTTLLAIYWDEAADAYKTSRFTSTYYSPAYHVVEIDGRDTPVIVGQNTGVMVQFGGDGFARRISPIAIYEFTQGAWVDVRSEYPQLIAEDAQLWVALLKREPIVVSDSYMALGINGPDWWEGVDMLGVEGMAWISYMMDMLVLDRADEACEEIVDFYTSGNYTYAYNLLAVYNDDCLTIIEAVEAIEFAVTP